MKILIINGPNLNLLGRREPGIYGADTFECFLNALREKYTDTEFEYYQSNVEGEIVDRIHLAGYGKHANLNDESAHPNGDKVDGIVLNAGAYTHTSIAIHDAIKAINIPVIEVHISNVHQREEFRHQSYISPAATGIIIGFGLEGYKLAIDGLRSMAK
ncbi:MAG: type II 3-dehydroquinate dehydratase [Bacteroidales bacterium]|nr:type II 3-dehydroquinate dehydratase [Candidatus Liminaster caballi]